MSREALVARLAAQVEAHRVVLVSAPAGAGKTSLLATLTPALLPRQTAWLALDAEDREPKRFVLGIVAALQALAPAFGAHTLGALAERAADLPPRLLVGALINDLLETLTTPFALILDDIHDIQNPQVFQALDYLIERLPAHGRLVLAARYDPPLALASLRARGQLVELRFDALRFSFEEARQLLDAQFQTPLSNDALALIHTRTEGWPAGLRLIALSLAQRTSVQRIETLLPAGQEQQHIFDLFAEEVLSRQELDLQQFLLETSILAELTPQLCRAVTGRADAGQILDQLHRRNLFVVSLDPAAPCYRYHALFRAFLEQHLERATPDALQPLHLRAGLAEPNPAHAVHHLLLAEAWEAAGARIAQAAMELYQRGHDLPQHWLDTLPAGVIAERAPLNFLCGVQAAERGEFARARAFLQVAVDRYAASGELAMQGEAMTHLAAASIYSYSADGFDRAVQLCDEALALPIGPGTKGRAYLGRVWAAFYRQDEAAVEAGLVAVLELMLRNNDAALARRVLPSLNLVLLPALARRDLPARFVSTTRAGRRCTSTSTRTRCSTCWRASSSCG